MYWENWMWILRCPVCLGELVYNPVSFTCAACQKTFPVHFGIPDFRLFPPNTLGYMSEAEDLQISAELFDLHEKLPYEELVRLKIRRESGPLHIDQNLQDLYIKWRLDNHSRAMQLKQRIQDQAIILEDSTNNTLGLDIGCGSGSGMATLLEIADTAIGLDLTISDLILAKSFLKKYYPGRDYFLFAGVAEHLPLASEIFSFVLARDVIEHVKNPRQIFKETCRVMLPRKFFLFNTASRHLLLEPHTRLPCVGYLPRLLQPLYVRLARRCEYKVHLPSLWELRRWLNESPFAGNWKIVPSKHIDLTSKPRTSQGRVARLILGTMRSLGLLNVLNRLLAFISYYEVIIKK